MKTTQVTLLIGTMVFAALLLTLSGHTVRWVFSSVPLLLSSFTLYLLHTEYRSRAVPAPPVGEEAAVVHKLTAMDLTRFACSWMLVSGALFDTLRIAFRWSVLAGFSFFTFTMALAVLVTVLAEGIGHYLGL